MASSKVDLPDPFSPTKKAIELLSDSTSVPSRIVRTFRRMAEQRKQNAAFHPNGPQRVLVGNTAVFTVLRKSPDGSRRVLCLTNITAANQEVRLPLRGIGVESDDWSDLLGNKTLTAQNGALETSLAPYQVMWLEAK